MSVFLDTAVIMYAAGADHPERERSIAVLRSVAEGHHDAVISTEVIQEIFHRFSRGDRSLGAAMARDAIDLLSPLLPISEGVVDRMPELFEDHPTMSSRDLIHAATCAEFDLTTIVSPDTAFDQVPGLSRLTISQAANLFG